MKAPKHKFYYVSGCNHRGAADPWPMSADFFNALISGLVLFPDRGLLESPFLEPLLRTLLRTSKTHASKPAKLASWEPIHRTFSKLRCPNHKSESQLISNLNRFEISLQRSSNLAFFGVLENARKPTPNNKDFSLCWTTKTLGKEGENAEKSKQIQKARKIRVFRGYAGFSEG